MADAQDPPIDPIESDGPASEEFGWQGWLLVGAVFTAFLVVPALIYLNARGVVALPFRLSFLVLPLFPAVVLAVLAVWVTTTA